MIGYLEGAVKVIKEGTLIIVPYSGVGYEVYVPVPLLLGAREGERVVLNVYTHVREDQLVLYGFNKNEELEFFKMLLSVSGIGPKVALAIISSTSVEKLKSSISAGDPGLLAAVSGVGKKTAEKAVVELRGKLVSVASLERVVLGGDLEEVYSALTGLGFKREEILSGIKRLPSEIEASEEKIRWLIKNLGGK